ncbi:hypothetical protein BKP35_09900 [Anaerobacillus arseniciselenatis]|uniref:DUF2651 domain-containing protein n=1 Tax=Anaerobacillus arseniciselenatis TaxID=85682 RepID=A0A1S2LK29_9BACI|nr:hypothetical protein [Anaerobacillus arseniciselenatis]OIJ12872.1 hypothetical protein BKP35_09900 [Anaerobacillus arseniciselenatis]
MAWLHIVILIGLISIIVPAMFSILLCFQLSNFLRSLLISLVSIAFTVTVTFYIYSDWLLYIMIAAVVLLSAIAGFLTYYIFKKYGNGRKFSFEDIKAG